MFDVKLWCHPLIVSMGLGTGKMFETDVASHEIIGSPQVELKLLLVFDIVLDNLNKRNKKSMLSLSMYRNFENKYVKFEFVQKFWKKVC